MPRLVYPVDFDVGGRSPKAGDGREHVRASRRLGLTHSLDSPRAPESEPAKPELPLRKSPAGELPRPRSASPRRNPAPPSLKGSALASRIERALALRASKTPPVTEPPPPKTRARFTVKCCEEGSVVEKIDDVDANAAQDTTVAEESESSLRNDDPTPVVVLPPAVEAETPPQEKESTGTKDEGCGGSAGVGVETGSSDSVKTVASVFGVEKSQIQASPQYWVPRKLSRSPVGRKSQSVDAVKARPRW